MYSAAKKVTKQTYDVTQNTADTLMYAPKRVVGVAGGATDGLVGLAAMLFVKDQYSLMPIIGASAGAAVPMGLLDRTSQIIGKTVGTACIIPLQMLVDSRDRADMEERERAAKQARRQAYLNQSFPGPQRVRVQVRQQSAYSYQSSAVPLTELESFLLERVRFSNKKRIYQALFDANEVKLENPLYSEVAKAVYPFFLNKIGNQEIYGAYMDRVICPIELDIADDPVAVPTAINATGTIEGTHTDMIGYKTLMAGSKGHLTFSRVFNPISRAEPRVGAVKPDYFAQQLIERIIHRCYQFREEYEGPKTASEAVKAQAHVNAIKRYADYTSKQPSPADRFEKALGEKGSYSDFIKYLMIGMNDFVQVFGQQHGQVAAIIIGLRVMGNLPKMAVLYNGCLAEYDSKTMTNPEEVQIAYDVQNVAEQLILIAHTHGDKFKAWNKAQQGHKPDSFKY